MTPGRLDSFHRVLPPPAGPLVEILGGVAVGPLRCARRNMNQFGLGVNGGYCVFWQELFDYMREVRSW